MTECIFCKIAQGDIPSARVYEDDVVYAFLDTSQVTPGHTLVIPKRHVENLMEYTDDLAAEVMSRLPKIARGILKAFPEAQGLNMLNNNGEMAYQTVFHSHIHLIPRYSQEDGFSLVFKTSEYTDEVFKGRGQKIAQAIAEEE